MAHSNRGLNSPMQQQFHRNFQDKSPSSSTQSPWFSPQQNTPSYSPLQSPQFVQRTPQQFHSPQHPQPYRHNHNTPGTPSNFRQHSQPSFVASGSIHHSQHLSYASRSPTQTTPNRQFNSQVNQQQHGYPAKRAYGQ